MGSDWNLNQALAVQLIEVLDYTEAKMSVAASSVKLYRWVVSYTYSVLGHLLSLRSSDAFLENE